MLRLEHKFYSWMRIRPCGYGSYFIHPRRVLDMKNTLWDLMQWSLAGDRASSISRLLRWRRTQHLPPKPLQVSSTQHGVIYRKAVMWINLRDFLHVDLIKHKLRVDRSVWKAREIRWWWGVLVMSRNIAGSCTGLDSFPYYMSTAINDKTGVVF